MMKRKKNKKNKKKEVQLTPNNTMHTHTHVHTHVVVVGVREFIFVNTFSAALVATVVNRLKSSLSNRKARVLKRSNQ